MLSVCKTNYKFMEVNVNKVYVLRRWDYDDNINKKVVAFYDSREEAHKHGQTLCSPNTEVEGVKVWSTFEEYKKVLDEKQDRLAVLRGQMQLIEEEIQLFAKGS
jgi:hypothetical protein